MVDIKSEHPRGVEVADEFGKDPKGIVSRWKAEIRLARKDQKDWRDVVKTIIERYREERTDLRRRDQGATRYSALWSAVKTMQPLLYSSAPKAEVFRRFKDDDDAARIASEMLARALDSTIDTCNFNEPIKMARDDYLLGGRGQCWVRYVPTFGDEEPDPETGDPFRPVVSEKVVLDYVYWDSFIHSPAPRWDLVTWVGKSELMTREQLVERFGEKGKKVELTEISGGIKVDEAEKFGDVFRRALVWEIWDKVTRQVIWICDSHDDEPLDMKADPLYLQDFFPCPRPIYSTLTSDSLIPVPDYVEWQSQAVELDTLTERISLLAKALKITGVYNGAIGDSIQDMINSRVENRLISVDEWAMFAETGGMKGNVDFFPIKEIAEVLVQLYAARERVKQDMYEITGLADIIRGASEKDETATAQKIKSRFAGLRLEDRKSEVSRFVRDILRIMAEIISEHFSPATLYDISNGSAIKEGEEYLFPEAIKLIRSDRSRTFRVDIETDSTVAPDMEQEREMRIKFLASMTPFLEKSLEAGAAYPNIAPLLREMLMFVVRGFTRGRQLEGVFEQTIEKLEKEGPGESGAAKAAKMQYDLDKMKVESDAQAKMADAESKKADSQLKMAEMELKKQELAIKQQELDMGRERQAADIQIAQGKAGAEAQKAQAEAGRAQEDTNIRMQEIQAESAKANADIERMKQELALKREELEIKQQELEIKREELEIKRSDAETKNDLARDQFNKEDDDTTGVRDIIDSLIDSVKSISGSTKTQQDGLIETIRGMQEAIDKMAEASVAPKRVIKNRDGSFSSETMTKKAKDKEE